MIEINNLLEQLRSESQVPALAAILVDSQSILAGGALGVRFADQPNPIILDDLFQSGSNAKAMIATVV